MTRLAALSGADGRVESPGATDAQRARAWPDILATMRPRDTSPDGHRAQLDAYRRMGAGRRAQLAARLSTDVRRLSRAGIRSRHPAYSDEDVELALRRLLYGDDLFRRAWPGLPLLAP